MSVYGPGDGKGTLISEILAGKKPSLTAGEQIWDYLYSADAAEAFYKMAECGKDGAVYVLGGSLVRLLLREYASCL